MSDTDPIVQSVAAEVAKAIWNRRQIAPISAHHPGFDIAKAYAVTAELRRLRVAHGETPLGRKIGFTNRSIWAEYGVSAPMWGDVYDSTTCDICHKAICNLHHESEPQIEPEIVFGFAHAPSPNMDERAMLGCIEWVAHGFEIVQSIFPKWKFQLADTIAANESVAEWAGRDYLWLGIAGVGTVIFFLLRTLKKQTRLLHVEGR